jgi:hypothetical protein
MIQIQLKKVQKMTYPTLSENKNPVSKPGIYCGPVKPSGFNQVVLSFTIGINPICIFQSKPVIALRRRTFNGVEPTFMQNRQYEDRLKNKCKNMIFVMF